MAKLLLTTLLTSFVVASMAMPGTISEANMSTLRQGQQNRPGGVGAEIGGQNPNPLHQSQGRLSELHTLSNIELMRDREAGRALRQASKGKAVQTNVQQLVKSDNRKRLEYKIYNMRTGKEEQYDARKHFFSPEKHHPDMAEETKVDFSTQAKANRMPPPEFESKMRTLENTFAGAEHLSKLGAGITDHDDVYMYTHKSMTPQQAFSKERDGHLKEMEMKTNGEVTIHDAKTENYGRYWKDYEKKQKIRASQRTYRKEQRESNQPSSSGSRFNVQKPRARFYAELGPIELSPRRTDRGLLYTKERVVKLARKAKDKDIAAASQRETLTGRKEDDHVASTSKK